MLVNATTQRDVEYNIVGVVGVAQDITESTKNERVMTVVVRELHLLVDTANAAILGIDVNDDVNECNKKTLLHSQGNFPLGAHYTLCFEMEGIKVDSVPAVPYPKMKEYQEIATILKDSLDYILGKNIMTYLEGISCNINQHLQSASDVMITL